MEPLLNQLLSVVLAWSLISMGAATAGLNIVHSPRWKAFWFMTSMWGLIDGAIVLYALLTDPIEMPTLQKILWINAGLDLVYISSGIWLLTRQHDRLKGFGQAILIQGIFLLCVDVSFATRIGS